MAIVRAPTDKAALGILRLDSVRSRPRSTSDQEARLIHTLTFPLIHQIVNVDGLPHKATDRSHISNQNGLSILDEHPLAFQAGHHEDQVSTTLLLSEAISIVLPKRLQIARSVSTRTITITGSCLTRTECSMFSLSLDLRKSGFQFNKLMRTAALIEP